MVRLFRGCIIIKDNAKYFINCNSGYAPIVPFIATISKQRGYSAFIVGLIYTLLPLPGLLIKPLVGALTDKYKCRKSLFVLVNAIIFSLTFALLLMPGATAKEEMDDVNVIKSPLFWLFFGSLSVFMTTNIVRGVLEDTICMELLGNYTIRVLREQLNR